jgi:hypothetical protein
MHSQVPQSPDDRAGGGRLARVHTGAGQRDDGYTLGIEYGVFAKRVKSCPCGYADAFTEIRKAEYRAEDFAIEWRADVRVG